MALKLKGSTSGFVGLDAPATAGNNTLILPDSAGSAHQILANDITAGVTTFTQVTVSRNGDLTVPGTISIGGTLTYEDVTSVDSVGIVTARGLSIFGNTTGLSVTGVGTFAGDVSIADKIVHTGNTGAAIRFPADNTFTIETGGSESVRITSGGDLGLGINNPAANLSIHETSSSSASSQLMRITTANGALFGIETDETVSNPTWKIGGVVNSGAAEPLAFYQLGSERLRIDSSGRLLLGTATARAVGGESNPRFHIEGSGATSNSWMNITRFSANNGSANIQFAKSRSDTAGTYTVVQDDDNLGQISFLGADGTDMANYAALIKAQVDGTPGSNDMPGRLIFSTTADGGTFPTERLRIISSGEVSIGGFAPTAGAGILQLNGGLRVAGSAAASDTTTPYIYRSSGVDDLNFATSGVERIKITSTGAIDFNVAGGETDIYSTGSGTQYSFRLLNSDATAGNRIGIYFGPANNVAGAYIRGHASEDFTSTAARDCGLEFGVRHNGTFYEALDINSMGQHDFVSVTNASDHFKFRNTTTSNTGNMLVLISSRNTTNNSYKLAHWGSTSATRFSVTDGGTVQTTNNSYGALSDQTLKENIVDAGSQWDDIKNLKVRKFNFIETTDPDKKTMLGVVAQEAETVCPNLVEISKMTQNGEENEFKTFKYSVLYMKSVKALQEAMTRIETLEAEVAALKGS